MTFTIGLIISTYNNPQWLRKTLCGYTCQSVMPDEIIIADDGSDEKTKEVVDYYKAILPIKHVWQEDDGFQKSRILNKALLEAKSDYLIFTDQDCIPRKDFIETHQKHARKGYFLSGGNVKLPMDVSVAISEGDIRSGDVFSLKWLRAKGVKMSIKTLKLVKSCLVSRFFDKVTTARSSWNGSNSSGWREDMLAVNGFNEEMHYGGQDYEFGLRMKNMGVKSKQVRFSAVVIHLDHPRPYCTQESLMKNYATREATRKSGLIRTKYGIEKL